MNKPFISLCPEITRTHAFTMVDWMRDDDVTRYLSDSHHSAQSIEQAINRVQLPIVTHLFNQGGRFFMACDSSDKPVGFVRLIKNGSDCEIVLVIGDQYNWGRRLGASTLHEGMKLAFFEMRAEQLIAKIHTDNTRSVKTFERCGFELSSQTPKLHSYTIDAARYLRQLRNGAAAGSNHIVMTELDQARLRQLVEIEHNPSLFELEHEIARAMVVEPSQVQQQVVTMNSRALLRMNQQELDVALVYPEDADYSAHKLSIFSDIGTAILGYREGDCVDWRVNGQTQQIQIQKVLYQPEAAGHYHL
ncbi:GNAT family N-acetyltransferase [Lampropedia aestuarii]|uniref:GNAT family N-acetyltransferase n=1 Tax=Lampropedia aestuarii TaxID=2562762 RepID=A0A4S5BU49_9BURK|nr:GNAT family N-acetyltransferase [Lampropedia aestuarii]THJ35999.1 GNAT family N-acetyltransferase [Lampropedia aestuarii]